MFGVFAATHKIWFIHGILFFTTFCVIEMVEERSPQPGQIEPRRVSAGLVVDQFAAIGLLVPLHRVLWLLARFKVMGAAVHPWKHCGTSVLASIACIGPLATYVAVRLASYHSSAANPSQSVILAGMFHLAASAVGACVILIPQLDVADAARQPSRAPPTTQAGRALFWFIVFSVKVAAGFGVMRRVSSSMDALRIARPWVDRTDIGQYPAACGKPCHRASAEAQQEGG